MPGRPFLCPLLVPKRSFCFQKKIQDSKKISFHLLVVLHLNLTYFPCPFIASRPLHRMLLVDLYIQRNEMLGVKIAGHNSRHGIAPENYF